LSAHHGRDAVPLKNAAQGLGGVFAFGMIYSLRDCSTNGMQFRRAAVFLVKVSIVANQPYLLKQRDFARPD